VLLKFFSLYVEFRELSQHVSLGGPDVATPSHLTHVRMKACCEHVMFVYRKAKAVGMDSSGVLLLLVLLLLSMVVRFQFQVIFVRFLFYLSFLMVFLLLLSSNTASILTLRPICA
jgi:hypothetical protein